MIKFSGRIRCDSPYTLTWAISLAALRKILSEGIHFVWWNLRKSVQKVKIPSSCDDYTSGRPPMIAIERGSQLQAMKCPTKNCGNNDTSTSCSGWYNGNRVKGDAESGSLGSIESFKLLNFKVLLRWWRFSRMAKLCWSQGEPRRELRNGMIRPNLWLSMWIFPISYGLSYILTPRHFEYAIEFVIFKPNDELPCVTKALETTRILQNSITKLARWTSLSKGSYEVKA